MYQHGKKLCALLLTLCMIIGFVPLTAQAAMLEGEDYITQQLSLGEDLVLHLRGNVPEEFKSGATATVTYAGVTDNYTIADMTPDENGLYDLPVELAVAQMTDNINLVLNGKFLGSTIEAINENYSIREYLKTLIEGTYTRETKLLAQELLNYGAAAQKYFDYNADNLANKGYDVEVQNPVPAEVPTVRRNGSVNGIKYYGTSVRFTSKTAVRFYFTAENGVDGYTFTVDGKEYAPTLKEDMYYIEVGGLNPQDMDTAMNVAVTDGSKTMSFSYAPTYYFIRNYHNTTDENFKGLMEAAYSYFMSAKDFAGVETTGDLNLTYKSGTSKTIKVATDLPSDTAIADFTFADNGCSVNEKANQYQTASSVSMANENGVVMLTFNFANDFAAGQTYSLPKDALFCFTDNSQFSLTQDFLFLYNGTDWTQVEASGDFTAGVDFEEIGNTLRFTGNGPANKAASVSRMAYSDLGISAPSNGGSYALKLTHADSYYPTFRINFGKELKAGTKISFMAYGKITSGTSSYNQSIFEFAKGGDATVQFGCDQWTNLTITLSDAAEYVDLFWNFDRANITSNTATGEVYVDNFLAVEPIDPEGDFTVGVDFEVEGNIALFTGLGDTVRDATIERVTYADAGITAPAAGGNYVMKLTHANNYWPVLRINFGKELAAGTILYFDAFTRDTTAATNSVSIFEYYTGGEATVQYAYGAWNTLSLTLAEAADHVDLVCTMDRWDKTTSPANIEVYLDNFYAYKSIDITGDILSGIDFETAGNELWLTGMGAGQDATVRSATYSSLGVTAPANGGSSAVKLSHNSHYYPTFQLNLGQEMKAGTVITFQVYGTFNGWKSGNDMNIEFTGDSGSGQVVYMVPEAWFDVSITLTEATDHLQFFWNIERGNGISGAVASYILIDNVKAVLPAVEPSGDILNGIDFETEGNELRLTGIGYSQDATIERATYADLGVAAPENGGSYLAKLSHNSHYYPTFQLNFGKTLPAGTTITFNVYGAFDGWKSGNDMNIEFTGDSGSGQVVYMIPEAWFTASITLAEATDHLQFFWNIERGNGISGDVASYILIDNVKAVEPVTEPSGDILEGYDFETAGNELRLSGIGYYQDATIERATYADLGVNAPANGGSYLAKLSHNSHYYPTFQLNFGRTLKAGSVITFQVYGGFDGWKSGNDMNIEFTGDSGSGQVVYMIPDTWFTATITLSKATDHLQFFWNIERGNGISGDVASYLYIDNVKATEPIPTVVDGLGFENGTDASYFTGVGGGNEWRDASFEVVSFDGDNALKLTCASSQWPTFRMNFGKTLPAGTKVYFDAYTDDTSGIRTTVSIFEALANCTETAQYYHGSWNSLYVTLTADCDYVDLMCNMDRWNEPGPANIVVYLDNVWADLPFSSGVDFEHAEDLSYFGGVGGGNAWRDASLEIASFDGHNALKLTCASSQWPTFRINFGETLAAGTTITFQAYTNDTSGIRTTVSIFEAMANCTETAQYYHGSWNTLTITLTADCDYVDLMCNMDRWNEVGSANIEVYIDNIVVG